MILLFKLHVFGFDYSYSFRSLNLSCKLSSGSLISKYSTNELKHHSGFLNSIQEANWSHKIYADSPSQINFRRLWASELIADNMHKLPKEMSWSKTNKHVITYIRHCFFQQKEIFPIVPTGATGCSNLSEEVGWAWVRPSKPITKINSRQHQKKKWKRYEDYQSPSYFIVGSWTQIIFIGFFIHCWYKSESTSICNCTPIENVKSKWLQTIPSIKCSKTIKYIWQLVRILHYNSCSSWVRGLSFLNIIYQKSRNKKEEKIERILLKDHFLERGQARTYPVKVNRNFFVVFTFSFFQILKMELKVR